MSYDSDNFLIKLSPEERDQLGIPIGIIEQEMKRLLMSKDKILNSPLAHKMYWSLKFGETVVVLWPKTKDMADPNDLMRPWLEENVGRQGYDWDWRVNFRDGGFKIDLKFRKKIYASQFVLIFSEYM